MVVSASATASAGCNKSQPAPVQAEEPRAVVTTHAAELSVPRPRTEGIESVAVPGDRPVLVVLGEEGSHLAVVHLHGKCLDPRSDLEAWRTTVGEKGTIVALAGEIEDCPDAPGMNRWGTDVAALDARITAAIDAVATTKHVTLDANHPVVIGESMGATRAMQLAHRYAGKYTQLILIGAPEEPVANDLAGVRRVALLAGQNEGQSTMRNGQNVLQNAGITSKFWELPDATHGEFGPEGDERMGEAIGFVTASN